MGRINDFVESIIPHRTIKNKEATAFAPSNIALCKYWGKRDAELNLPVTSSLSISLSEGTETTISQSGRDEISLNGQVIEPNSGFYKRLFNFIDLFREPGNTLKVTTKNTVPTAAGLASSASGFAATVLALNDLFNWQLNKKQLSLLARVGSGSASRSLWHGFVEWHRGERNDGLDAFAEPLNIEWPELAIDAKIISSNKKQISSREAMNITVDTSPLYQQWPSIVEQDLKEIKAALQAKDFKRLGEAVEHNAIKMHETMRTANPSVNYDLPETQALKEDVWARRKKGELVYFTQDAGPNLKVLTLRLDSASSAE